MISIPKERFTLSGDLKQNHFVSPPGDAYTTNKVKLVKEFDGVSAIPGS
jgi:hypothetical protein